MTRLVAWALVLALALGGLAAPARAGGPALHAAPPAHAPGPHDRPHAAPTGGCGRGARTPHREPWCGDLTFDLYGNEARARETVVEVVLAAPEVPSPAVVLENGDARPAPDRGTAAYAERQEAALTRLLARGAKAGTAASR